MKKKLTTWFQLCGWAMILDHCNCRNKNREETQLIDWNNQITECVWLLCLDGFIIIIIIIIVIVSSSSAAPHHFLHSFHTATYVLEKPPLLMWKPQGSPKSHPIEIHYLSCLSVHTVQTPHSFQKVWIQKSTQLFLHTLPTESDTNNNNNCHHTNNDNIQPQGQQQQQQ
jgi:hypothetical protein